MPQKIYSLSEKLDCSRIFLLENRLGWRRCLYFSLNFKAMFIAKQYLIGVNWHVSWRIMTNNCVPKVFEVDVILINI